MIALHTPSATQALPQTLTPAEEPDEASPAKEPQRRTAKQAKSQSAAEPNGSNRPTIEQALHLRDELRTALEQTRQLISCIRRDRKRSRLATR